MEEFLKSFDPPELPGRVVAGIVPHAGWYYSGRTAARVFSSIKSRRSPRTFILLGTVHVPGVRTNSLFSEGEWVTPLGSLKVDETLAERLLDLMPEILIPNTGAHTHEHSIEVQTPMIKYLFPDAMILPIAVPPSDDALELGAGIGKLIVQEGIDAVVIGSTDLTHYGDNYGFTPAGYGEKAHMWMLGNDGRIISLAVEMNAEWILREAAKNHNACGPGAMAATVAAAKAMGAERGYIIERTTSHDVRPSGGFDMAVGYAGIVF